MSSAEYLAVVTGLAGVWAGVDGVVGWLDQHEANLLWGLALPI
ncbi:hypothetical protein [Spiribacter onubensis]|uniref:Uncharacterized protein n=1 Tax=Spiribacter onubensis TaxID=3122420 RepID=A0ABV3S8G0_9GAMM